MGLFDNMLKNKMRKRKDGEIEKAESLMKEGNTKKLVIFCMVSMMIFLTMI